ncbi:hypothetical protein MMC28_005003 [Mycoblastus sanguinarius]|nr:hypothetical protein [Mycoblastus sanguinarius]
MAPGSISELAPELILQIFESLNNYQDITALNATSGKFYSIWQLNAVPISNAVFIRSIDSFDDALELLDAQREPRLEISVSEQGLNNQPKKSDYEATLERNKQLISNDLQVSKARMLCTKQKQDGHVSIDYKFSISQCWPDGFLWSRPSLTDFTHFYYRVWIIAAPHSYLEAQASRLGAAPPGELECTVRMAVWIRGNCGIKEIRGSSEGSDYYEIIPHGFRPGWYHSGTQELTRHAYKTRSRLAVFEAPSWPLSDIGL